MSNAMLETMMKEAEGARVVGQPLEIDALLYSNNSIFGIVGKNSPMMGQCCSTAASSPRMSAC